MLWALSYIRLSIRSKTTDNPLISPFFIVDDDNQLRHYLKKTFAYKSSKVT